MSPALAIAMLAATGTIGSGLGALLGAWNTRRQHKTHQDELDEQHDRWLGETTRSINEAAESAVRSMQAALGQAEEQMTAMRAELAVVRDELRTTRDELHDAIAARDHLNTELATRDVTIASQAKRIEDLERKVAELEARLGGRRDSDPPRTD